MTKIRRRTRIAREFGSAGGGKTEPLGTAVQHVWGTGPVGSAAPNDTFMHGISSAEILRLLHAAEVHRYQYGRALPDEVALLRESKARGLRA